MIKRENLILIVIILLLSFIPFGCDEENSSDSKASVVTKVGYVYIPSEPKAGKNGVSTGLIALEQNVPPQGYEALSDVTVSIGDNRVKTDDKGSFSISGIQPGEHQMLVSAPGFQPVVQMTSVASASATTIAIDTMKVIPQEVSIMRG